MKKIIPFVVIALLVTTSCNVDKKGSVELPEVEVDVEEGNLPSFDVDWADIDVGTRTEIVTVPKVKVVMEEVEVEVPVIDVDMPDEDKEQMSIVAEAEVDGTEHEITIQEIRATNNRLYVISTLESLNNDLGDEVIRVQDQVELNAPDLDIKHIIVGNKPNRSFNNRYSYVSSMDNLPESAKNAQVIYKR